jgi:TolB-like protein/DNA-binding winged helix-turn-helix (wHTH) protein/Flp pilus assembly protein TadD
MVGAPESRAQQYRFGPFHLDAHSGELRKHGIKLKLRGHPIQILLHLLEHPGELVTREQLRKRLWPADTFVDFDHGLNSAIKRLRRTLLDEAGQPRYIETVPRRGYRFISPVECVGGLDDPARSVAASRANSAFASRAGSEPSPALELVPARADGESGAEAPTHGEAGHRQRTPGTHRWLILAGTAVLVLFAISYFTIESRRGNAAVPAKINSLAVLPLKNLSGDPGQEYLADGMTETLIGRLSAIHDLRVISRTSVMRFKSTQLSVPEIARALGADAIVEGSIMREGGRIRVHAQLVRAATDEHFWSESYDREPQDILGLESDVAQAIAQKVEVTVTGEERARLIAVRRVAPEAHESYLKGLRQLNQSNTKADKAGLEKSIPYFETAIKSDATFAPAYVGLARAYMSLSLVVVGGDPGALRPKAISAARKALELDPELADAHTVLASINLAQWRWSESQGEFERALRLNPNDASAHFGFAHWLLCQGRTDEAIGWSQRARKLDPLGFAGFSTGWILFHSRHYDEAIRELRSAIAVNPDDAWSHWLLGFVLIVDGHPGEAIPVLDKTVSMMQRSPGSIGLLASAYAHAGRRDDALRLIKELEQRREKGYVPAAAFVIPYLSLGENDRVFEWLERAYNEQSTMLQFLKVYPGFDSVRGDPRFSDLLRRVGLE